MTQLLIFLGVILTVLPVGYGVIREIEYLIEYRQERRRQSYAKQLRARVLTALADEMLEMRRFGP